MKNTIPLSIGVVAFAFLICFAVAAWTEPSVAPPGGNVPAPLHVGLCSDGQILQKADGYNWDCVAIPSGGGGGEPGDFDCKDCDTRFVNESGGDTIEGSLTVEEDIITNKIYLNAVSNEGDIENVNAIVGYDDLFIRSNKAENKEIYIAGKEIKMYTGGGKSLIIDARGDVTISKGMLILPYLRDCAFLSTDSMGRVICSMGLPPELVDPCKGVVCNTYCKSATLLNYNGVCANIGGSGVCQYQTKVCAYGCENNVCKPKPGLLPLGASCNNNSECESGYCSGGVCAEPPGPELLPIGASCSNNSECESGYCHNGVCAELPGDKKGLGESCSAASQCASGYCVDGVCCNNACSSGRDCQTCGALTSHSLGIGHCGYVKTSSADPRNDCTQGSTCKSNNCSGKGWSCGVVAFGQDGGCPACMGCNGKDIKCQTYSNKTQDKIGPKTCKGCKYCVSGSCKDIPLYTDPFNECGTSECGTGSCNGSGKCDWLIMGEGRCPVCKTCNGATSTKCKYFGAGEKDQQGNKTCFTDHERCNGSGGCTAPTFANQTNCLNLGSNNCSGYCPGWCASNSMCESCMIPSMRVFSNTSCSGAGSGVFSGSCNQSGGGCKCFYVEYQYPF